MKRLKYLYSLISLAGMALLGIYLLLPEVSLDPDQFEHNSFVYSRDEAIISEFYRQYRRYTPLDKIPGCIIDSVLAAEDKRFYRHPGVDPIAIVSSIKEWILGKRLRGASTITQQLVRMIHLNKERTFLRKLKEAILAFYYEISFSKNRILEAYLNLPFLGGRAYGVSSVSFRLFNKHLNQLKLHECALIAGLFQSPSRYDPHKFPDRARRRQGVVLESMARSGFRTAEEVKMALAQPLKYEQGGFYRDNPKIGHFLDYVKRRARSILGKSWEEGGYHIVTTLDLKAQDTLIGILSSRDKVLSHKPRNQEIEAAFLVLGSRNGHIIAMQGSRDYQVSKFNRSVDARRAPGSAIKPLIYSLAIEKGLSWADLLPTSAIKIGSYRPRGRLAGAGYTTLINAFRRSINSVNVSLGATLGLANIEAHAKKLGLRFFRKDISSLLGSSEVTMIEMAKMYAAFENGGMVIEPIAILEIRDREGQSVYQAPTPNQRSYRALKHTTSFMMAEGLKASFHFGTGQRSSRFVPHGAGKTGTSNRSRDNWFCGFVPGAVGISWVGLDKGSANLHSSGASTALPAWAHFFKDWSPQGDDPIPTPPGVKSVRLTDQGKLSTSGLKVYLPEGYQPGAKLRTLNKIRYLEDQ